MYREIDDLIEETKFNLFCINNNNFNKIQRQLEIAKRFFELYEIEKIPKR